MPSRSLSEFAPYAAERVNAFMARYLETLDNAAPALKEAMSYGLLLGGKRSRPLLVYATGTALGQSEQVLDYVAAGVECIHAYSLIHDDMPEMDNDKLRRGKPTVHVKFGQSGALLAGDALQALAFRFLSDKKSGLDGTTVGRLVHALAVGAGYEGMCGGQALDLDAEKKHLSLDELKTLHSKKTGALIRCAVNMGAMAAPKVSEASLAALDAYAAKVGLAFQVWDDVLDVIGDTAVMGKTAGSDESLQKSTYPALLGIVQAKQFARETAELAKDCLKGLDFDTSLLSQFADFCVTRDH